MAEIKSRKKARKGSVYACHFYEEGIKAIGFLGFIGQMASFIDHTRYKAASALYEFKNVLKKGMPDQHLDHGSPPVFQPITMKTLEQFDEYVSTLVYIQIIDQMNCYIVNVLTHIFSTHPNMLKSNKTITLEKVISFSKMEDLCTDLADGYVQSIMYKSTRDLFKYLKEMHGIDPFNDSAELDFFSDCNLKRNLLVHNFGRVNKTFLQKCSKPELFTVGSKIKIDAKDTFEFLPNAISFLMKLDKYLCEKFSVSRRIVPANKIQERWASFLKQKRKRGRKKSSS